MKLTRRSVILLAAASLGAPSLLTAAAPPAESANRAGVKTVRLLTIGNSFSRNATRYLGDLVKAGGHELIHRPIVVGGASLQVHAEKAQAFERDPRDQAGLYADGKSLRELLGADRWDFITIQQASIKSHDLGTFQPYAGWLHAYLRKHAPQARVCVHQTWAYRRDDKRFSGPGSAPDEPATQAEMYQGLANAYGAIAKELGLRIIPVGDAFYRADTNPRRGYQVDTRFDFKTAAAPALPDQTHSLHVGWLWRKQKDGRTTLGMDGHHANGAGEYLGACVWYEVLFGESVVGNEFVPPGMKPDYARFLQQTAHEAVAGLKQP